MLAGRETVVSLLPQPQLYSGSHLTVNIIIWVAWATHCRTNSQTYPAQLLYPGKVYSILASSYARLAEKTS